MPERGKYDPTENPGDERERVWRLEFDNPVGGIPSGAGHEETVIRTQAGIERTVSRSGAPLTCTADDPDTVVPLFHPQTMAPLGTMTKGEIHVAIFSLGHFMQTERDAAAAAAGQDEGDG